MKAINLHAYELGYQAPSVSGKKETPDPRGAAEPDDECPNSANAVKDGSKHKEMSDKVSSLMGQNEVDQLAKMFGVSPVCYHALWVAEYTIPECTNNHEAMSNRLNYALQQFTKGKLKDSSFVFPRIQPLTRYSNDRFDQNKIKDKLKESGYP